MRPVVIISPIASPARTRAAATIAVTTDFMARGGGGEREESRRWTERVPGPEMDAVVQTEIEAQIVKVFSLPTGAVVSSEAAAPFRET